MASFYRQKQANVIRRGSYNGLTKQLNAAYIRITTDELKEYRIYTQINKANTSGSK